MLADVRLQMLAQLVQIAAITTQTYAASGVPLVEVLAQICLSRHPHHDKVEVAAPLFGREVGQPRMLNHLAAQGGPAEQKSGWCS